MIYRCRTIKPNISDWYEIHASSPGVAANDIHTLKDLKGYHYIDRRDNKRVDVYFALMEIEDYGNFISRYFSYLIYRGGVQAKCLMLEEIAKELEWNEDPAKLLEPGWDFEESMEEATKRKWK